MSAYTSGCIIGGVIFSIAFIVIPLLYESRVRARLGQEGVVVEGTVREKQRRYIPKSGIHYSLISTYHYQGMPYTSKQTVRKDLYDRLDTGDKVTLRCLPGNPEVVRIAEETWQ